MECMIEGYTLNVQYKMKLLESDGTSVSLDCSVDECPQVRISTRNPTDNPKTTWHSNLEGIVGSWGAGEWNSFSSYMVIPDMTGVTKFAAVFAPYSRDMDFWIDDISITIE